MLRSLREVDRQAGLTPARLSALSVLVFGGPCTLGVLAAAEGVAGPTMTRIVDGLIAEGLAERRPHPTDGRAVLIGATQSGEALMRAAQHRRIEALATGLSSLPVADRSKLSLAAATLDELAAAVRSQPLPVPARRRRTARARGGGTQRQSHQDAARARWAQAADQLAAAAQRGQRLPTS